MKNLIILISILISNFAFGQEPYCRRFITIKNVETNLYEYKIQFGNNYNENNNIDWTNTTLKSENGKEIFIAYSGGTCHPNNQILLPIIIVRKNKENNKIEEMKVSFPLKIGRTSVEINEFREGINEIEIYEQKKLSESDPWILMEFETIVIVK